MKNDYHLLSHRFESFFTLTLTQLERKKEGKKVTIVINCEIYWPNFCLKNQFKLIVRPIFFFSLNRPQKSYFYSDYLNNMNKNNNWCRKNKRKIFQCPLKLSDQKQKRKTDANIKQRCNCVSNPLCLFLCGGNSLRASIIGWMITALVMGYIYTTHIHTHTLAHLVTQCVKRIAKESNSIASSAMINSQIFQ